LTVETKYGGTVTNVKRKRVFQVVGAATVKLRESKHVRTCGTANKLQSDERSLCSCHTFLQGMAFTQTMLGELTIHPPVADFPMYTCQKL